MKCSKCNTENPEGRIFCRECGSDLILTCPQCSSETLPSDKFCGVCRYDLTTVPSFFSDKLPDQKAQEEKKPHPKSESARKYVTVLFSDLSGYTTMTEKLDPEEVKEIMGKVFGEISKVVTEYEGFIEKFIGDAVVALFGVPRSHEDDPVRAIRAAREIHDIVSAISPRYEKRIGKPLSMHTGLCTGLVVTGNVDAEKGTHGIVGDTINKAARLSGLAKPGETFVDHETYLREKGYFIFDDLGTTIVKGKSEPVHVYRLAGTKDKPEQQTGISSPLVGREKEMDLLSLQVLRLINGEGGIVTITGEAGIGKSRLMAEFRSTDKAKRVLLLEGRAISVGRNLSFYPIIDALKHWSGIRENDSSTEAHRKLERAVHIILPKDANEVFPFIATLMGMKLSGKHAERVKGLEIEALEKLIFKNIRELVIKGSQIRPTIIYIEDFHWIDTSSLELINALFRLVGEHRILFILVFRPGYADTGERVTKFVEENYRSHWTRIDLSPLNEAESESLLSNLLQIKGLSPVTRNQILQRASGNPFFLEEMVRSLIDQEAVVLERGEYRTTDKINNIIIPQSIHALIMTRIDRLDETTRDLIRVASVIGRNFFHKILTEVASNIEEIDRRLSYLKEIKLIRERKRMEELEYLFKHALAQEAAYESILLQRRKELHNRVARSIEKVFKDRLHEFYGMLAYHYGMGEDQDRAEEYMIKAGEEAMKSAASSEALGYFEEALAIYRGKFGEKAAPVKIAMLEENIAHALHNRGRYLEAADYFTRVLEYYGESIPKSTLGISLKWTNSLIHLLLGLYVPGLKRRGMPTEREKKIIPLYYYIGEALSQPDPKRFFIEAIFNMKHMTSVDLSGIQNGYGMFAVSSTIFSWPGISRRIPERMLDYAKHRMDHHDERTLFYYLCASFLQEFFVGNFAIPDPSLDSLTEQMIERGEFMLILISILFQGYYFLETGLFARTMESIKKLHSIYEEYNHDAGGYFEITLKMRLLLKQRRFEEALSIFDDGIPFIDKKAAKNLHFEMHALKANALIPLGEMDQSRNCLEYLEAIRGETPLVAFYLSDYLLGRLKFAVNQLENAVNEKDASFDTGVKDARLWGKKALRVSKKFKRERVEVLRIIGTFHWLTGKENNALKWWHLSEETGQRYQMKPELARTYFEIGKRLSEPKSPYNELNGIGAGEYLEKARTMFHEMDLQWDMEQLEFLMEHLTEPSPPTFSENTGQICL